MIERLPPTASLVIAFLIFFAYVAPTYSGSIADLKAEIGRQESALAAAERFDQKKEQLAQEKGTIAPTDLERLEVLLPDSVDNVGIIMDLTTLMTISGIQLATITVPPPIEGANQYEPTPSGELDFSLEMKGTYASFLVFLSAVENSLRILDVKKLEVKGSDTGVYTFTLGMSLYWLR